MNPPSPNLATWLGVLLVAVLCSLLAGCKEPAKGKIQTLSDPGQSIATAAEMGKAAHEGFTGTTAQTKAHVEAAKPLTPPTGKVRFSLDGIAQEMAKQDTLLELLAKANAKAEQAQRENEQAKADYAAILTAKDAEIAKEKKRADMADDQSTKFIRNACMAVGVLLTVAGVILAVYGIRKTGGALACGGLVACVLPILLQHLIKPLAHVFVGTAVALALILVGAVWYSVRRYLKDKQSRERIARELAENMQRAKVAMSRDQREAFFGKSWPEEGGGIFNRLQSPELKQFIKQIKPELPVVAPAGSMSA
jgi:membrane protein implicated in regulation of membrane protease activity